MRCVLEVQDGLGDDSVKKETVVSEEDSTAAFRKVMMVEMSGKIGKVVLWREFDSMEEAPSDDGCCYHLVEKDGKRVLRRCIAAC